MASRPRSVETGAGRIREDQGKPGEHVPVRQSERVGGGSAPGEPGIPDVVPPTARRVRTDGPPAGGAAGLLVHDHTFWPTATSACQASPTAMMQVGWSG